MAEAKTQLTKQNPIEFLENATEDQRLDDCKTLVRIMEKAAGAPPRMWGSNIVGFGSYTYKYASGQTGDWPLAAFAPRRQHLTIYLTPQADGFDALLTKLGKHKMAGGCLHIKKLSDVDPSVLTKLISASVKATKKKHTGTKKRR
jgi:Domain of unknown function (DU1801)